MRLPLMAAVLLLSSTLATPLFAAPDMPIDTRVSKLETEMRAVQRKVFPGGDTRYFEPEITPPVAAAPEVGAPATSPVADLTARVGALESELQRLTGQVEQDGFKLKQLEDVVAKLKGDAEFRLNRLENGPEAPAVGAAVVKPPMTSTAAAASSMGTTTAPTVAGTVAKPVAKPVTKPVPAAAATAAAVPALLVAGATGDPAEDGYMAAYRLWNDKKYAEAEAMLKQVVAKYPAHKRASYAQNLLGRAYLDEGNPALAAEAFYTNYQKMPRGERAPDSLYYLAQALIQLKRPKDACRVYDQLSDSYGPTMAVSLKDKVTKGRADAKCAA